MQRWCQRKGENIRLALIGSLVVLATATGSQWWNAKIQLKKAEKKAQLAQKNADLVASRESALEAELKKAQEQAQPPQRNADLAAGERGALESQLKEAEKKAQLAQKNADLATSDRSALESQLKKAEERAQLAETSAALTANQPNPEQIQPANARTNAEVAPLNQSLDSTIQSAQTDQVSASVPATADAPSEENRGIGSTDATARITAEASPTPTNKPVTRDQEPAKPAQINQSRVAISLRTPTVAASVESTPSEAQTDRSIRASAEERSLKEFVLEYIRTVASNDFAAQERFFADRVNFEREGAVSFPEIRASRELYDREWPMRKWEPRGEPEILRSADSQLYEVLEPFTWTVSDGLRQAQGTAALYIRIQKNAKGEFQIVHIERRNR